MKAWIIAGRACASVQWSGPKPEGSCVWLPSDNPFPFQCDQVSTVRFPPSAQAQPCSTFSLRASSSRYSLDRLDPSAQSFIVRSLGNAKKLRIFYSIEYFKSTKFMSNYG